ncbi:MAG: CAP domain-containing protein [Pelagimonas sp.]|jgi:uncharacterized protein YkwD|nr:CAP domain-containing protein [Pelagimonas sp.]
MRRYSFAFVLLGILAMPAQAQQVRQLLNGLRAELGLGEVQASSALERAAMRHALDMSEQGFFDHQGSDGSTAFERARAAGYQGCQVSENIARGHTTLHAVMGGWVHSANQRKNMILPRVVDYGLVRAEGDIWVLLLGQDEC